MLFIRRAEPPPTCRFTRARTRTRAYSRDTFFLVEFCAYLTPVWFERKRGQSAAQVVQTGTLLWDLAHLSSTHLSKALCGSWKVKQHNPGHGLVSHFPLITVSLSALPLSGSWHLFMTSHRAQVVFFFLPFSPPYVLHAQTVRLQYIIFCPSQNPIGAILHSGSVLAGTRTYLKDDLNVSLHSLSKRNSLYLLYYSHLFIRFGDVYMPCSRAGRPNAAESTQPLQNSHVWAREELIMLQPTLSAAPRPWKWDRLDIFFPPLQTCSRNCFLFLCAALF